MSIADIPLFSTLKSRMSWLQSRQVMLAENVANAATPGYQAREIEAFTLPGTAHVPTPSRVVPVATNPAHIGAAASGTSSWGDDEIDTFEVTPSGNSVVLEEEMMKVAETQLDYQMATGLYSRSLGILKTALGRRA